jgi:putative transposase
LNKSPFTTDADTMSEQMNTALVETALQMALRTRQPDASLLHHSDQGSQYTSAAYQSHLPGMNIQLRMSRVGNCYDNAVAESFFGTLKAECVTNQFASHAVARTTIFEYMEVWYNRQRCIPPSAISAPWSLNSNTDINCVH